MIPTRPPSSAAVVSSAMMTVMWALLWIVCQGTVSVVAASFLGNHCGWRPGLPRTMAFSRTSRNLLSSVSASSPALSAEAVTAAEEVTTDNTITSNWQAQVLNALKVVIDPDLNADIVSLGFVQNLLLNERDISFDLQLTSPACPVKEMFETECIAAITSQLPWVDSVSVTMTSQPTAANTGEVGLSQVSHIIAVSSCKGGVGKSTTAVNLAFSLQQQGASVGIFDVDLFGPSLPTMVKAEDDIVRFVGRQVAPLQRNQVKLMSFGFINDDSAAAIMRGPMITQLLDQFLSITNWGALDYLILDMPPGTGDIQLTLTQRLNITAAVIVTTPQELSYVDVVRGIDMFDTVNVPCIAVVENMAYYQLDEENERHGFDVAALEKSFVEKISAETAMMSESGGPSRIELLAKDLVEITLRNKPPQDQKQIRIFGPGHTDRLSRQYGIETTFQVPLQDRIAANSDAGTPFVLQYPDSPISKVYKQLAQSVVQETSKIVYGNKANRLELVYNSDQHVIEILGVPDTISETISTADLRRACRCASCVEELTGKQILLPTSVSEKIKPVSLAPTGNYAVSINWSDGHRSLYPYRQVRALLEEKRAGPGGEQQTVTSRKR
jgi:Mrp family chromosome partitioning ATPase/DUF971 family protein